MLVVFKFGKFGYFGSDSFQFFVLLKGLFILCFDFFFVLNLISTGLKRFWKICFVTFWSEFGIDVTLFKDSWWSCQGFHSGLSL